MIRGEYHAQILDPILEELALLWFQEKIVFSECLQNPSDPADILFSSLGEAQDVIQVHNTYSVVDPFSEDIVDHVLEGAGGVAESEEHDQRFEESLISPECHLQFFSFCHPDILKAPSQVRFPKHFGSSESVNDIRDQG
jgi:hypothetical protein